MADRFDVVILGAGPAGAGAGNVLTTAGKRSAPAEPELSGGECTNWGCIPSKTLLRPPDLLGESRRAQATGEPKLDWPALSKYRDYMVSDHDDTKKRARYRDRGLAVYGEPGRLDGPGRVEVGDETLEAEAGRAGAGRAGRGRSWSRRARRRSSRRCRASPRRATGRTVRRPR